MSNRIFHDLALEAEFQKNGFVRLPLLSAEEIEAINEELNSFGTDAELRERMPFYVSLFDTDLVYKNVCKKLVTCLSARFESILFNYRFTLGNLFCKFPDSGELDIHDHAHQTDESKYTSITVWIPLCDTDVANATLELVERSHKLFPFITHWSAPSYFYNFSRSLIDNYCRPTNARAGEAIIFCDRLIHYTGPNLTETTRRAIQLRFLPNEAPFLLHYVDVTTPGAGFEIYECSAEYFNSDDCSLAKFQKRPEELTLLDVVPNINRFISEAEFQEAMAKGDSIRANFYR